MQVEQIRVPQSVMQSVAQRVAARLGGNTEPMPLNYLFREPRIAVIKSDATEAVWPNILAVVTADDCPIDA